jgi:hypothetical protein
VKEYACPQCPVIDVIRQQVKDKEEIIRILNYEILSLKQQLWLKKYEIN